MAEPFVQPGTDGRPKSSRTRLACSWARWFALLLRLISLFQSAKDLAFAHDLRSASAAASERIRAFASATVSSGYAMAISFRSSVLMAAASFAQYSRFAESEVL